MGTFRKKPVVIQACRFVGGKPELWHPAVCICDRTPLGIDSHLHTLEGPMKLTEGDWIITGVKGEVYACKPDIFELTYERIEEDKPDKKELFKMIDYLEEHREAKWLDGNLTDNYNALPTITLTRDQLVRFRNDYITLMNFAAYVLGKPVEKVAALDMLEYLYKERERNDEI